MALGDLVSRILGQEDPRVALAAAATGGQPGAPATPVPGAGPTGAGTPTGPQGGGAGQATPSTAVASPPDLSAMYLKLVQQDQFNRGLDSAIATIGAGFAQPGNRASLLQMAQSTAGGGGFNAKDTVSTLAALQKASADAAMRAQLRGRLPAIAKQYGLPLDTVTMLFESGKLDETLNTLSIPATQVVKAADGSNVLVDTRSGREIRRLTPAEAKKYELRDTGRGGVIAVNPQDPTDVRDVRAPEEQRTNDLVELDRINKERFSRGEPPISAEQWLRDMANIKAPKTSIDLAGDKAAGAIGEGFAKTYVGDFEAAQAGAGVINQITSAHGALDRGIVAGNIFAPTATEARKVVASFFGIPDEKAANTDAFQSAMKEIVLPKVKALGTGNSISNADVAFISQAVGSNTMTPETVRTILRIMEKGERNRIAKYNANIDDLAKKEPAAAKYARRVDMPPLAARVPPASIERLRSNPTPEMTKYFDETYGAGAAEEVLRSR
jgi:hypothetical protein